ncbi:hypothetical protein [Arsenicibacter rosenii]|uniref:Uncharacterized protein n=1 Tax=Arsenicibacter rosenii TaxID=1750698 RepID=A0A1S2VIN4_9BACT|nr:hypothetical protein [Arsenicibacter rosenii]OIN57708.1 hypothetical protein BLX24_18350 [Arsenicibacter rosenii]
MKTLTNFLADEAILSPAEAKAIVGGSAIYYNGILVATTDDETGVTTVHNQALYDIYLASPSIQEFQYAIVLIGEGADY